MKSKCIFKENYEKNSKCSKELSTLKNEMSKLSTNYEVKLKELKTKSKELEEINQKNITLTKELDNFKTEINNEPSTSSGFKGFTNEDKLCAIEDLITMQGKSMQIMTESFKSVIQELNVIKKSQKVSVENSLPQLPTPKFSYAEVLIKRNAGAIKSRNITLKNDDDEAIILSEIKKNKLLDGVTVEKVKKLKKKAN